MGATSRRRRFGEHGVAVVEYALLLALVAVMALSALRFVGASAFAQLRAAGDAVAEDTGGPPTTCPGKSEGKGQGKGKNCS